jgi:hypothetical protein
MFLCLSVFVQAETQAEPPLLGDGSEENPYQIANLANLRWLSETPSAWGCNKGEKEYFIQTADIDASETTEWNGGCGFRPIGDGYVGYVPEFYDYYFYGEYDGKNHVISNLFFNNPGSLVDYGNLFVYGFFGLSIDSSFKNIRLENINFTANDQNFSTEILGMGGLVGYLWGYDDGRETIKNCSVTGNITVTKSIHEHTEYDLDYTAHIGGLAGAVYSVNIENCYSKVNIHYSTNHNTVYATAGGVVAYMNDSSLSNSFFYGSINSESEHIIKGGLGNRFEYSDVHCCYATTITPLNGPGLIRVINNTSVRSCFWDTQATGSEIGFDEIVITDSTAYVIYEVEGMTTDAIINEQGFYTFPDWDFVNIWGFDININNGYPHLRSFYGPAIKDIELSNNVIPLIYNSVYPNPVKNSNVQFKTSMKNTNIEITIYNVKGQLIKKSKDFSIQNGENIFVWNRKNEDNRDVASGIYFYRIKSDGQEQRGKLLIIK